MLHVVQSNEIERLSSVLAMTLSNTDNKSIFDNEIILVQSPGMATWLKLQIAMQNGIACGLSFPLPSSYIWQLCANLLDDVSETNFFSRDDMKWKIFNILPGFLKLPEFNKLDLYLANMDLLKLMQLSIQIAAVFDQYLVYRPQWILDWESGIESDLDGDALWQPILWRALINYTKSLGQSTLHRANSHFELLQRLTYHENRDKLPSRIFVFGISYMPYQDLEILHALAKHIDVYILNLSPCRHYWGDIIDAKQRAKLSVMYANRRSLDPDWESKLEVGNPILANNGKMGRELLDAILELPDEHINIMEQYNEIEPSNLLHGLQYDILELETRGEVLGPSLKFYEQIEGRRDLKAEDDSVIIYRAHCKLREVESLFDHLLSKLEKDPTLKPGDILVMLPDVASYASYIDAVFGSKTGNQFISYAISDCMVLEESPLINSFLNLLVIKQSRFTLSSIIEILEVPAISNKFGFDRDSLDILISWLKETNIRWSLDDNKDLFNLPPFAQNSWSFGIRRMILGYAFGCQEILYKDSLSFSGIEGQDSIILGNFLDFLEELEIINEINLAKQESSVIIDNIREILGSFYETTDDVDEKQLNLIREAIDKLEKEVLLNAVPKLDLKLVVDFFTNNLTESRLSRNYLAACVNFCNLTPMRAIPFKTVCILGLNSDFPRANIHQDFNLIKKGLRKRLDRSKRLDDRYLFLEAILSTKEQLYLSYIGYSIYDNSPQTASILIDELLEYFALSYFPLDYVKGDNLDIIKAKLDKHIIQDITLQPFSAPSYAKEWFATISNKPRDFVSKPLDIDYKSEYLIGDLFSFYNHPLRFFCNNSLNLSMGLFDDTPKDNEPFKVDLITSSKLLTSLVFDNVNLDHIKASGILPLGAFGDYYLNNIAGNIGDLVEILQGLPKESYSMMIELDCKTFINVKLLGTIHKIYKINNEERLITFSLDKNLAKSMIMSYLQHLILNASARSIPSYFLHEKGFYRWDALDVDAANLKLEPWIRCFLQGLAKPLPLPIRTGFSVAYELKKNDPPSSLFDPSKKWKEEKYDPYHERMLPEIINGQQLDAEFESLVKLLLLPMLQNTTNQYFTDF